MLCSYCLEDKDTVDRDMFDGLCADCTDKALNIEYVADRAKKNNVKLKNGQEPMHECPCESSDDMMSCDIEHMCDGVWVWK